MTSSCGTLKQDNCHIISRPKISTRSAVKIVPEYSQKIGATRSAAQERPSKPKRTLVHFDQSDENIEEEDYEENEPDVGGDSTEEFEEEDHEHELLF